MFGIVFLLNLSLCFRYYRHSALVLATLAEVNDAVNQCIECVILTNTYVQARVVLCTALANDDVACDALLATPDFNA